MFEGNYINEEHHWYLSGQLKRYNRYTPTVLRLAWSEDGILLLEHDEKAKVSKEFYKTGELKCEYVNWACNNININIPTECICYSKEGDWIYKHRFSTIYDSVMYGNKYVTYNEPYIYQNYLEILHEKSFHDYIFLLLKDILISDRKKAVNIICNLISHDDLNVKERALTFVGYNKIKEAKSFIIKELGDSRVPPSEYNGIIYYSNNTKTISEQAKATLVLLD